MDKWTRDWPNAVGDYWFYGYRYGKGSPGRECGKEMSLVKVSKCANGFMHTCEGQFFFKSEIEDAYFKKAVLPKPPNKEVTMDACTCPGSTEGGFIIAHKCPQHRHLCSTNEL